MARTLAAPANELRPNDYVAYAHPDFGSTTGRVIRVQGAEALCQDLAPNGAREWWAITKCRRIVSALNEAAGVPAAADPLTPAHRAAISTPRHSWALWRRWAHEAGRLRARGDVAGADRWRGGARLGWQKRFGPVS